MSILPYTEAHTAFRARLADFLAREVTPRADEFEQDHLVPKSIWTRMGSEGFLCTEVAKEYGGPGLDFLYSVIVAEEVAKTRQSGLAASLHSDIVVPYVTAYGNEDQKKRHLPGCVSGETISAVAMTEPGAGSDLASMACTAVEEGGEVVINGAKTFISNGIQCGLVVLAARDPAVENPYQALSLYLVEDGTPGFTRGRKLEKMGMYAQDTAELFFSNCRIPMENRLGEKGQGFLMLMQKLQQERLMCAIMAVAASEFMVEMLIAHCKAAKDPAGKPMSKRQAVQFALVEMATEAKLGRALTDQLILSHMAKKNVVVETSMAKYWTTEQVKRHADRALDIVGTDALLDNHPLARAFRDVRIMSIFAGANEIMKIVAARFMGL
ncbi:MAG: acyl-CoA dehydrogenase family protein [Pseudomonadota bacterium]